MDKRDSRVVRAALLRQRAGFTGEVERVESDLRAISEDRESELEERAAEETAARVLSRLDERGQREIEEIDAALERLEAGSYGLCTSCGDGIDPARLRAMPATALCIRCARERERRA